MHCVIQQFAPYSDFNFVSMWSWDTDGEVLIAELHGNLVVRFFGYIARDPFLMYIGRNRPNETASALIEHSKCIGLAPELRLIPHCIAQSLDAQLFSVTEEPDQADYIVSTREIERYDGQRFAVQRNFVGRFLKLHPMVQFAHLNLSCADTQAQIRALYQRWHAHKNPGTSPDTEHEYHAIVRCLNAFSSHLISTGLYFDDRLVAFCLVENVGGACAVCHFEKAETAQFVGIVPYLRQRTAKALRERGIEHINLEQDLGIPGLRQSKRSYGPVAFLKKYRVG